MGESAQICELVRAAQQGDREAFDALVRRFEPLVRGFALRQLRDPTEAAELTQDTFVRAYRKIGQLREPAHFVSWLKRITVRLAINRAVRRPAENAMDPSLFLERDSARATPLEELLTSESAAHLRQGLKRLRDIDRHTLHAFYFEGQSVVEMSDRFSRPVGTIKRRLHTARLRLRKELDRLPPVELSHRTC